MKWLSLNICVWMGFRFNHWGDPAWLNSSAGQQQRWQRTIITFHDTYRVDHPLHFCKHTGTCHQTWPLSKILTDATSHPLSQPVDMRGTSSLWELFFNLICHGSVEHNSPNFLFLIACALITILRAVRLKTHWVPALDGGKNCGSSNIRYLIAMTRNKEKSGKAALTSPSWRNGSEKLSHFPFGQKVFSQIFT